MKLKYGHYAHVVEGVDVTINRTCLDAADLFEVQINGSIVTKAISKAHFPARQQYEEQAASEIAAILAEHRKQIVRAVGSPPKYGNIPAKLWRQQTADFVRVLIPVMTRAHLTADKNLTRRLGGKGAADVIEDAANLYAQDAARDLAGDLVRTTRKGTRDALAATREQLEASGGKFTSVLAAKLVTVTGPSRASMIAVTETTNAHTAGESAAATRWNAEAKREARRRGRQAPRLIPIWVAQPGCCDVCLKFDGAGREVWGKEFPNGPSAHPSCRCRLRYILANTYRKMLQMRKQLNECGQQADGRFDQGNTCAAGGASVDEYVVAPGDTLERRRAGIASLLGYESKSPRIQYDPATGTLAIQPATTREERAQDARVLGRIADVMRRQTPPAWQSNAPWYSALVADNERIQATWKAAQAAKDADDIARATAPTPNEEQLGELLFPPADRVAPVDATAHIGDKYKKLGTPRIKLSGYSIPEPHVRKPTSMKQAKEDVAALVAMAEQNHKDYQTGSDFENVDMRESALKRAYNAAVRNAKEKGIAEDTLPKYPAKVAHARDASPAVARAAVKWSAQSTLADIQREAKKRMAIGTVEVAMTGPDKQLYKQAPKAGTLEAANTALEAIASTNKKLDGWYKRAMSPLDMVVVDQKPDNTTPLKVVSRYAEGSSMPGAKGNRLEIAANPVDRRGKFPLTAPLTIGEEYVDRSIAGNARRAYGLHLWKGIADQFVSPVNTLAVEWGTAMGNTKISEAVFSAQDAFAESVSAYTHPDYQPGDLPESIEQFLDKYFVQETTPLIQKKYRLGVRKQLNECGQNKDGTFATGNTCAAELNRGPAPPTQVKLYGDTFVPSRTAKEKASWLIKAARIFQNKNKFGYVVVDEAKLQAAEKNLHATLDKMPPIMARMAANNINNVVIYNNLSELTLNFLPGEFGEKLIKNGKQIGGAFDGRADEDNTLHLDGLEEPYTDLGIEGLYAHELGHAVDVGLKYSSQPAWKQAWEIEIKLMSDGEYRLSKYAAERPSEGWAEYCRLIVTDPVVARERFPACWGLLERAGFFEAEKPPTISKSLDPCGQDPDGKFGIGNTCAAGGDGVESDDTGADPNLQEMAADAIEDAEQVLAEGIAEQAKVAAAIPQWEDCDPEIASIAFDKWLSQVNDVDLQSDPDSAMEYWIEQVPPDVKLQWVKKVLAEQGDSLGLPVDWDKLQTDAMNGQMNTKYHELLLAWSLNPGKWGEAFHNQPETVKVAFAKEKNLLSSLPKKSVVWDELDGGQKSKVEQAYIDKFVTDTVASLKSQIAMAELKGEDTSALEDAFKGITNDANLKWGKESDEFKAGYAEGVLHHATSVKLQAPKEYKTVCCPQDEDYQRTQQVAQYIQKKLATKVYSGHDDKEAAKAAEQLWMSWKGSSTQDGGLLLQYATAKVLGGKHRLTDKQIRIAKGAAWLLGSGGTRGDLIDIEPNNPTAAQKAAIERGMKMAEAHVYGTWAASQFVLKQAGVKELPVYRGLMLPGRKIAEQRIMPVEIDIEGKPRSAGGSFDKLVDLDLEKNGAASFTTDRHVANNWNGVGELPPAPKRVVLRALVPREAVLSLPVFGQNVTSEEEVVVAGVRWNGVDAWLQTAPAHDTYKGHKAKFEGQRGEHPVYPIKRGAR